MSFIHPDFLLQTQAARRLFHEFARDEPIVDYHNHLSPRDIASNRRFENLWEIWLEGDHYKWRAMRASGVEERFCTGDANPSEKFLAWAKTVPQTLRNPLFHWTHLELARYFEIFDLLHEKTAPAIWEQANSQLSQPEMTTQGILRKFQIRALCTTDDPAESLEWHQKIADSQLETRVYPTFRPDKAFAVQSPDVLKGWTQKLAQEANLEISNFADFLAALEQRHDDFHAIGGRLSDHGLTQLPGEFASENEAREIWNRAWKGQAADFEEQSRFSGFLMLFLGELDAKKGWTKQLHLGALRNNNGRQFQKIGPDTGFDSIGDWPQAQNLGRYLDALNSQNALPKIVIYNLNPADNYALATMVGNFAPKVQFGSGWWFLDQKEAMEWQLNALSNNGLLAKFIGMLTDSRSFMSFPRHEYFRRVLCNLVGRDIESGELPADFQLVGAMISNICYHNAREFLELETK